MITLNLSNHARERIALYYGMDLRGRKTINAQSIRIVSEKVNQDTSAFHVKVSQTDLGFDLEVILATNMQDIKTVHPSTDDFFELKKDSDRNELSFNQMLNVGVEYRKNPPLAFAMIQDIERARVEELALQAKKERLAGLATEDSQEGFEYRMEQKRLAKVKATKKQASKEVGEKVVITSKDVKRTSFWKEIKSVYLKEYNRRMAH